MTDPREQPPSPEPEGAEHPTLRERVGEAVERAEERVEHAVEEVAEEVAEHVPEPIRAPVKWTVRKLILVIGISLVGLLLVTAATTAYYVWNHTEWASHELTGRVNQVLKEHSDLHLSIDGLRGNPLARVEVIHPRVRFEGESGPSLLEARAMTLRYSTWNLFAGRRGALVIDLDQPVVRLQRGADGKLRIPGWLSGAGPARRRPGRGYDFVVRIRDGQMISPEGERWIRGFVLGAEIGTGGGTSVEIRSLSWKEGPTGLPLESLVASISAGDSVKVQVRDLKSPSLALTGDVRWKAGETRRTVTAEIARVEWRWLARLFRNKTFDVPGEGAFSVRATQEDFGWTGAVRTRANWNGLPLESNGSFAFRDGKLTMPSLQGTSIAGDLADGRLSWSKAGWEISGRASRGDPSRWTVLGLQNWPAGELHGRFRYAVDTRARPTSELTAQLEPSVLADWRADSGVVRLWFPPDAPDSFHVDAMRRGGRFALRGRTQEGGWAGAYRIQDFPLDEWADGRATGLTGTLESGAGTVTGKAGGMWVTGTLSGRSTRWLGMDAARWRLDDLSGRLLPTPELDAQARLEDMLYLGLHFDSTAAPIHLGDRTLTLPALAAWAGDTVVTMTAEAGWDESGWRFTADQAQARSRHFDWRAMEPIRISGNREGVTFERLVAMDGEARLEIMGRWAVPGGSYDWQARASGLRLERLGLPDSLALSGRTDVVLAVRGVAGDPRWDLTATGSDVGFGAKTADSLRVKLAGAPSTLEVSELAAGLGDGWVAAEGRFLDTARPWPDTLTTDGVLRWLGDARSWSGRATARDVALERLAQRWGLASGWSGRLEGRVDLSGRPGAPEFDVELRARPLSWRTVRLDEVVARARYADDRLRVEQLRGTRDQTVSDVTGEMELELALGRRPEVLDAPMSWRVELPNGDLSLLALVVPQVGWASGRFIVHGDVRGTPRRPQLDGTARIIGGRLRVAERSEVVEQVNARITFDGSKVMLDSLTAVQHTRGGERGRVWAHGQIDLAHPERPTYRFETSLRDFTASEPGLYAARFDGDFVVTDGVVVDGRTLPHVTSDNIEIHNAAILWDFTRQTEVEQVEASTQKLIWTYRLAVHATDNLRWLPPDGDIEFSADLNLQQTPEKLLIFGDMEALRGTYYFLSNRFTVRKAKLNFDDVGGVDPLVDAEADTRLTPSATSTTSSLPTGTSPSSGRGVPHTITVLITNRASVPKLEFRSDPDDLDQAMILRELTLGRFVVGEQVALADPLDSYLSRAISRQLSAELSTVFRGYLTDWEIARQSGGVLGGEGSLLVGVGAQVNNRLALRYRQRVPGTDRAVVTSTTTESLVERDVEAEYRLSRFFYVTSQLTQKRTAAGTVSTKSGSPEFNVNLKARWEY